jgi:hypothetical protein
MEPAQTARGPVDADVFFGPSKWPQLGVPTRFLTAEALAEQGLS